MEYLQYLSKERIKGLVDCYVLNLIINGIPSIQIQIRNLFQILEVVLNLIINGIPSIRNGKLY